MGSPKAMRRHSRDVKLSWFRREARRLSQESIVRRFFRRLHRLTGAPAFDDRVELLRHHPLSMFFYNQRALVFGITGALIFLVAIADNRLRADPAQSKTLAALVVFWIAGVGLTLVLHRGFLRTLRDWAADISSVTLPRIFDRYFLLDSVFAFVLCFVGSKLTIPLETFAWVLLANTVAYTAYASSGIRVDSRKSYVILAVTVFIGVYALITRWRTFPPGSLHTLLYILPMAGAFTVTLFSVAMIGWLRTAENSVTQRHIAILGDAGRILALPEFEAAAVKQHETDFRWYREKEFHTRITAVLNRICSESNLWYRSASLWLFEDHYDRGVVMLPAASHNFPEVDNCIDGVDSRTGFLSGADVQVVRSLADFVTDSNRSKWRFRTDDNIAAAFVPIRRGKRNLGALLLYGTPGGPSVGSEERPFLTSLGEIVASAIDQWDTFLRSLAVNELDALFKCKSLEQLLERAVVILRKYLSARGCMIVFRKDPTQPLLAVAAIAGFNKTILGAQYESGIGLTGTAAASNEIVRIDDVERHRSKFDGELLKRLEKAHGAPITSWIAIPLRGPTAGNFGVIKAVNSTYPCRWFTKYDERLGNDLALRLHVVVDKLLHVQKTEEEKLRAVQHEQSAVAARQRAEELARRRQEEIMTIMHQLQGPLISVVNALTAIEREWVNGLAAEMTEHATALAEDAIAVGYGTLTIFAQEAGRATAFQDTQIDAAAELRRLAYRLQRTQSREDLTFRFQQDPDFPKLTLDADAFTSVFYSLIHNAMKYADEGSEVVLQCGFEGIGNVRRPALKVKTVGEPINPAERELIFEKFRRGTSVDQGKRYKGVGLGLWVARNLMYELDGDLTLELSSQNPRLAVFVVHIAGAEHYA